MPKFRKSIHGRAGFGRMPIYPLLAGLFPVLSLAAYNLSQIDLAEATRSILLALALTVLLFGLLRLLLRDWIRAGFLTGVLLLLFYSYGHVYNLLMQAHVFKAAPAGHIPLAIVWAGLAGLGLWLSVRKSMDLSGTTLALNVFSIVLLAYPLFQIGRFETARLEGLKPDPQATQTAISSAGQPDIYYIILDAYDRADTLKLVYDYDNSGFLSELKGRGFFVANCSQSNYAYTEPSLASSLNLDYLDSLSVRSRAQADRLLQQNAVRGFLKAQGYQIIAFESGFSWSQWEDADVYYHYQADPKYLNGFEALLLRTTLVRLPLDYIYSDQDATHGVIPYQRILYSLDTLKKLPGSGGGPKFVFAHLSIPHPPFVFGPNGEFVTAGAENATSLEGYRNSVGFINRRILEVVDEIFSKSSRPAVILLQGDHGAPKYDNPAERMGILNAYYLPGGERRLYDSISPVNTFRVIFNQYFGQNYPILDDVSFYSYPNQEYEFGAIPNECGK